MAKITLYHDQSAAATCVPNIFIDQYMTRANGEYVKIYLYLLRCFAQPSADFSLSGLADHFDCTGYSPGFKILGKAAAVPSGIRCQ